MLVASVCDRPIRRHRSHILLLGFGAILLLLSVPHRARPLLIWNLTRSAPLGLYSSRSSQVVRVGDWVVADLPPGIASFATRRRYIGEDVPVLKRVAGVGGDHVCASAMGVEINNKFQGARSLVDGKGRILPAWSGCLRLGSNQLFLINREAAASFDSRYFGPIARSRIIAVVRPVWTRA